MRGRSQVLTASIVTGVIASAVLAEWLSTSGAQQTPPRQLPEYTASGDLVLPKDFTAWVYVGSPLTQIALNGGKKCPEPATAADQPCTGFPEYHNVYIEPGSYEIFKRTSQFPEQTIIFKELQLTLPMQNPDGSRTEVSGRGFFPGAFNGAD